MIQRTSVLSKSGVVYLFLPLDIEIISECFDIVFNQFSFKIRCVSRFLWQTIPFTDDTTDIRIAIELNICVYCLCIFYITQIIRENIAYRIRN